MSRYLIIDTESEHVSPMVGQMGKLLSEKETLKIFKDVWDSSFYNTVCPGGDRLAPGKKSKPILPWNEFKKTL